jgi:hypothetical protein
MSRDDDLDRQLRAFGETLQHTSGEPIRPSSPVRPAERRAAGRGHRSVLAVAAAAVVVIVGAVLLVGGADRAEIPPATLPSVDLDPRPPGETVPAPTAAPTTAPTTAAPDDGLVVRDVEPFAASGTGPATVEIPLDPIIRNLIGYIEMTHDGDGPFRVTQVYESPDGELLEEVVVDTAGAYRGRRQWRLVDGDAPPVSPRSIDIVADGNWTIELQDFVTWDVFFDYVPGTVIAGSGDAVLQPFAPSGAPPALTADVECAGCAGDIEVVGVDNGTQVVVSGVGDGGTFRASGVLPKTATFLLVRTHSPGAAGDWTITLRERDEQPPATEP